MAVRISPFQARYVRHRATELMVDQCKIWKAGSPLLDRVSGNTQRSQENVKYEGRCRFWEVSGGNQTLIGDQQIVMTQTYFSIPFNAPVPESDDIVQITASVDPDLVGRTLNILTTMRGGGLRASRRFTVELIDSQASTW